MSRQCDKPDLHANFRDDFNSEMVKFRNSIGGFRLTAQIARFYS
ncbi:hypothetical protein FRUB_07792 [Fimbriiglobus ruber]|uniref:Uncharacterized protein n=1 Tax=Fimbriiglobus ruber TaxID=1908690 RepID=A0A225DB31_9BACT|nr:hypothetical protein FRUB_07792 [Fimbriiglobus ruber]